VLLLVALTATASAQQDFQLKVDVSLVSVDVGVFDRQGDAVTTLKREDFVVLEDGERQNIRAFESSNVAFNALLVVDDSGSMRSVWDSVVKGLNRFMEVLRVQDRIAIATFDSGIHMAANWRSAHSSRAEKVGIAPEGQGTDFYSAMAWAAGYIKGEKGRKGVIVFSDGKQSGGGFGGGGGGFGGGGGGGRQSGGDPRDLKKALDKVRQANIPFYLIGYSTDTKSAAEMKQFAEASGGRAYFPKAADEMVGIYEQIGRDLGRAYSISYSPEKPADGKFRKIDVRTLDVRLKVAQSRDGYYAR